MKTGQYLLLLALLVLGTSCSVWPFKKTEANLSKPELSLKSPAGSVQVQPLPADIAKVDSGAISYKKDDLTLRIKADPQLNRYQNNAHTLLLCVYQLKDPNAFNQLAEDKESIAKLLECLRFDGSVANAKRIVVQPGQELKDIRDRAEGARFIGIAAGYFGSPGSRVTHLAPLALARGDFSGNTITIELGPNEIEQVTVK